MMKQADFARLHNVSRKTVTQWKARGWLVMDGDDIDVDASNANIEQYRKTVTRGEKKKKLSEINPKKSNQVTIRLNIVVTLEMTESGLVMTSIQTN
ncbi:hypothetical protein [Xenorhabdus sp. Sc-CR9]|uniref:hypothetical protein n=1 Tax=Xenorhabdus sp. Sc-CR9 TaxID=2584468 RepID=UPI001F4576E6|nr:hypothetical protein [Xenorhabdus sp. Sc-CR9]